MAVPFVGLTGGIGAGKSTALAELEGLGAAVLSADRVVHELYETDAVRDAVRERFGAEVFDGDAVDRAALARRVFAQRRRPRLARAAALAARRRARRSASASEVDAADPPPRAAVVEAPLLFEAGSADRYTATIAIVADDELRAQRVAGRDQAELERRELRQLPQARRRAARATSSPTTARARSCAAGWRAILAQTGDGEPPHRRTHPRSRSPRVALAAVLLEPTVKRIVRDLTLPLDDVAVIREQAREKHLDPALIAAVIYAETKFDARTSPTGAIGLMQIEPATAEFLAHRSGGDRLRSSPTSRSRRSTSPTAATTCATCSTATTTTRRSRSPPTTAARPTSTSWLAQAHAAGRALHDRLDPVPADARLRRARRARRAEYAKDYGL